MGAVAPIIEEIELLHELNGEIVPQKRNVVLTPADFEYHLPPVHWPRPSFILLRFPFPVIFIPLLLHFIPALLDIHEDAVAEIIRIHGETRSRIHYPTVQSRTLDHFFGRHPTIEMKKLRM